MTTPSSRTTPAQVSFLPERTWRALAAAHESRADTLTEARRERIATGTSDEVEDFLFTYYPTRPGHLRRWHPGVGVALVFGDFDESSAAASERWHRATRRDADTWVVELDAQAFLADRVDSVRWIHSVLTGASGRRPQFGCFGLHEWAMVYRQAEHRHTLPLRLSQEETDSVVAESAIQCSHFDAFRFFTPAAKPLNVLQPTPESRVTMDQPGCLHANMDLLRHATKLGPAVPGDLLLDCFELARDVRVLDMEASPYNVSSRGYGAVPIETASGRAEYVRRQRQIFDRSQVLRTRLVAVTSALLALAD